MKSVNKNIVAGLLIGLVIGGGGGYYLGSHKTAPTQQGARGSAFPGGQGGQRGGFARGGNALTGNVISLTDNILTIKGRDGGSRVVLFTGTTKVSKSVDGTRADIKEGANVLILGSQNSDGSITAENVQIRPFDASSTRPQQ